jgi:hypothetical protein
MWRGETAPPTSEEGPEEEEEEELPPLLLAGDLPLRSASTLRAADSISAIVRGVGGEPKVFLRSALLFLSCMAD